MQATVSASAYEVRQFAGSGGLTLTADVGGDPAAPTIVMLHGRGQTRHSWAEAMRSLVEEGYHVVNYDARGHGDSGWDPSADYSMEARAADLEAVLGVLPGPIALVGASMGGMTSFHLIGRKAPPAVKALVMVDIVPRSSARGVEKIRNFLNKGREGFASLEEAADAVAAYNPARPRPADVSGLGKNLRRREDGRYYWHWDPNWPDTPGRSDDVISEMLALAGDVTIPSLLVRGLRSELVEEEAVAEFRAHFPALEVYDVAGASHMVAGDRNDAFNEGVISFLRRRYPVR